LAVKVAPPTPTLGPVSRPGLPVFASSFLNDDDRWVCVRRPLAFPRWI
jgi:hypothetical protein